MFSKQNKQYLISKSIYDFVTNNKEKENIKSFINKKAQEDKLFSKFCLGFLSAWAAWSGVELMNHTNDEIIYGTALLLSGIAATIQAKKITSLNNTIRDLDEKYIQFKEAIEENFQLGLHNFNKIKTYNTLGGKGYQHIKEKMSIKKKKNL